MYKITTGERMLQNLVVEYEKVADPRLPACSRKAGQLLETSCTIMDLKGVGLYNMNSVYGYVKQASAISQNYYPERLGKLYLINAPWGFSSIFHVVKGFLDAVTVEKIQVLGSNYQHELLKQIPKQNLPKMFGGSCDCDVGCALSDPGPWQDPQWARPPKWLQEEAEEAPPTPASAITGDGLEQVRRPTQTTSAFSPSAVAVAVAVPTDVGVEGEDVRRGVGESSVPPPIPGQVPHPMGG